MSIPACSRVSERARVKVSHMDSTLSTLLRAAAQADRLSKPSPLEEEVVNLFDQFRDRLLRYALSFGLSIQDGEEIVQEVFLSLFQHLQRGKPRQNLQGWLFRVTHNLALRQRGQSRRNHTSDRCR